MSTSFTDTKASNCTQRTHDSAATETHINELSNRNFIGFCETISLTAALI